MGPSEPTIRIRCGWRLTDRSYHGDNRLVPPKSSYRRRCSAPRCRLILSWWWRSYQGFGCSPIKKIRELGSNRRGMYNKEQKYIKNNSVFFSKYVKIIFQLFLNSLFYYKFLLVWTRGLRLNLVKWHQSRRSCTAMCMDKPTNIGKILIERKTIPREALSKCTRRDYTLAINYRL